MSGSDFTRTPNLGLYKPTVNADVGNWGAHWNSNADTLDVTLATTGTSIFLPTTGGTVSGPLFLTATKVNAPNLPKSTGTAADLAAKGLVTGDLYINGGVVCVAP
jgi:hypothetical protein